MLRSFFAREEGQGLFGREAGQGLVEYALILALIAIVAIAIMTTLGTTVASVFSTAQDKLTP